MNKKMILRVIIIFLIAGLAFFAKGKITQRQFDKVLQQFEQSGQSYNCYTKSNFTDVLRKTIILDKDQDLNFEAYSTRFKGSADLVILDENGIEKSISKNIRKGKKISLHLTEGRYFIDIKFNHFSGSFLFAYDNNILFEKELDKK